MALMTAGISNDVGMTDYVYTIEDENGRRKTIVARDKYELGERIAEGAFEDDFNLETPAPTISSVPTSAEFSSGGGAAEGILGLLGAILGFIVFMAILTEVAPRAANIIDTLLSLAVLAGIGWVVFRIVKKFSP